MWIDSLFWPDATKRITIVNKQYWGFRRELEVSPHCSDPIPTCTYDYHMVTWHISGEEESQVTGKPEGEWMINKVVQEACSYRKRNGWESTTNNICASISEICWRYVRLHNKVRAARILGADRTRIHDWQRMWRLVQWQSGTSHLYYFAEMQGFGIRLSR